MKTITKLSLLLIAFVCISCAASLPPPHSEKRYDVDSLNRELYDLNGQVVKILYTPHAPHQDSSTTYGDSLASKKEAAYIVFPKEVGDALFKDKRHIQPFVVYVQVTIGKLSNPYGGEQEGPVLIAVGRETRQDLSGPVTYAW